MKDRNSQKKDLSTDEKREERFRRITTAPLYPLLWKMAIPSMVGMVVSTIYSMTDTYFIGKLNNTVYTASVGVVFTFISIIQAIGFWFGYGSGNYISRMLGKKDTEEAQDMAATGLTLGIVTGICLTVLGMIFLRPLAKLIGGGASEELLSATERYLRITLVAVPFMMVSNVIYNQLRLAGSGGLSMAGLLLGMAINMILDPVFILLLGLEIEGAAYASLAGQVAGSIVLLRSTGKGGNVKIDFRRVKADARHIREILSGGAPNFCRQGISSISSLILNVVAGGFGEYVIAALTIAQRVAYIAYALVIGFGQGFQPICALNYGAGNRERIVNAFRMALLTVTAFLIITVTVLIWKSEYLITRFTEETLVADLAVRMLRAQSVIMPFMGYYILIGMLLQNIGRFGLATMVTIAENGTCLIPMVLILPVFMGVEGIVWCKAAASLLALIFSFFVGTYAVRKYLNKDFKEMT